MAIFRLSAGVVKRAAGRSAVAAAAYRSGTVQHDERLGQSFDYRRRRGVEHAAILAPEGAPAWMADRERLWNGVEAVEKRKDAQLAREVQLALPHELSHEQRVALVTEFVRDEFVAKGMVADLAIHAPDRGADERNHHAHVMLTLRDIEGDGFGKKNRDWNGKEQLQEWREHWAERVNEALEREGHEARIDHRTLEAQGLEREAQPKLGPAATELERRGVETDRGDMLRAVLERNADRAILVGEAAEAVHEARDMPAADPAREKAPGRDGLDLVAGGLGAALGKLAEMAEGLLSPPSPVQQIVAKHAEAARHEAGEEARHLAAEPMARPPQEKTGEPPPLDLDHKSIEQEVGELMRANARAATERRERPASAQPESVEEEVARLMQERERSRTRERGR